MFFSGIFVGNLSYVKNSIRKFSQPVFGVTALLFLFVSPTVGAQTSPIDFRISLDHYLKKQSDLEGTNGISILRHFDSHTYWGGTIYSAALGNAGGFFVGGFELGQVIPLPYRFYLDGQFYIGGGGGASQVPGSGLMLRPRLSLGKSFDRFSVMLGSSWVRVTGSDIDTPSVELAIVKPLDLAYVGGHPGGISQSVDGFKLRSVKPVYGHYLPQRNIKRNGTESLQPMNMFGVEFTFADDGPFEYFILTNGVVGGDAEGYADWYLGLRRLLPIGSINLFADIGAGVGGGGAVDTGGGVNVGLNAGMQIPTWRNIFLEPGVAVLYAPTGDFLAYAPTFKVTRLLNTKHETHSQPVTSRWQVRTGVTHIPNNERLRKANDPEKGSPTLMHLKIETYVSQNNYFTGQAFTAFRGDAGGFQIGLIGIGHRLNITPRWNVSGEAMLGAGGGAGIDTNGGALASINANANYHATESLELYAGAGWLRTIKEKGMNGAVVDAGVKFLFTLFH